LRERHYLLALLVGQAAVAVLMGSVVLVLDVLELAELVVPVGFEGVGDEPVVGVDGEVAAACEFGVVAGAFDVLEGAARRLALRVGRARPRRSARLRARAG
jgi:hypothetical protein